MRNYTSAGELADDAHIFARSRRLEITNRYGIMIVFGMITSTPVPFGETQSE